jgi:hypothetical protein
MRTIKIDFNTNTNCYDAEIRDSNTNLIDSATSGQKTKNDLNKWLNHHDVTKEEYNNAIFNY